jgi:DNA-binding transcriptional LysR family regulator
MVMTNPGEPLMHEMMVRFAKTVECGGVSAAARELHISQPAVTKSLHQLSEHYEVPLLVRGKNGVTPTEYGQMVYRLAKILQKSMEDVGHEIDARRKNRASRLKIGAGLLWCYVYLPAALENLTRRSPGLKIEILLRPPARLHEMVCRGDLDIGLGQMPSDRLPGIIYEELLVSRSALFAHRRHPLTTKARLRDRDLQEYPWAV